MPLEHLIDAFNHRFGAEQGLAQPPLAWDGRQVEGRLGGLRFGSILQPVRLAAEPARVIGHDAVSRILETGSDPLAAEGGADAEGIVNLDRLSRTVHMLNYLPLAHADGSLFLHVHPRHVLAVKRDHGAYFEDIIQRCGLTTRRVVITLAVSAVYDREFALLIERMKNYRDRGYATAIKFDDRRGANLLDRYCVEFLYRFIPDFVRFEGAFFPESARQSDDYRHRSTLLSAIRRLDTQLLIEGVRDEAAARLAESLQADFVKGAWYEQRIEPKSEPRLAVRGR
jgi:EAL domain-containing protein (putative c-di-GMP-specific phosphodiesterase class I)